jgi:hypothetical protein
MNINNIHRFSQSKKKPTVKERFLKPSHKQIVQWRRAIDVVAKDPDFIHESKNIGAAKYVIELVCQHSCIERAYHAHESLSEFAYVLVPDDVSDLILRSYNAHYNSDFLQPILRTADILHFPKK